MAVDLWFTGIVTFEKSHCAFINLRDMDRSSNEVDVTHALIRLILLQAFPS
jgi:hypothetical protein